MKFSTKLDSDELYCVAKTVAYCLSVSLFVHFSFSPMEISVSDFSGSIGASVFKGALIGASVFKGALAWYGKLTWQSAHAWILKKKQHFI